MDGRKNAAGAFIGNCRKHLLDFEHFFAPAALAGLCMRVKGTGGREKGSGYRAGRVIDCRWCSKEDSTGWKPADMPADECEQRRGEECLMILPAHGRLRSLSDRSIFRLSRTLQSLKTGLNEYLR